MLRAAAAVQRCLDNHVTIIVGHVQPNAPVQVRRRVSADVTWNRLLGILAFRVNVEPRPPDANKAIFLEKAFCDCILREVCAVGEAD